MFQFALPKHPETVGGKIIQDAPGESFGGVSVRSVGRNKLQFIASPGLEATGFGGRCVRSFATSELMGFVGVRLGPSIRNAAGSHGHRSPACAAAASTRRARTPP